MIVEFAPGFGPLDVLAPGDWVDLSDRLLSASWSEGRDDELEHYGPGEATIVLTNEDRELDPDYAAGTYFGDLLPRTPFRIMEDGSALELNASGEIASTPDHASLDITADVLIGMDIDPSAITGASAQTLLSKWVTTGNQRSYLFQINSTGFPRIITSPDGTLASQIISTSTAALPDANRHWVWVQFVSSVLGVRLIRFYTSETRTGAKTQLGTDVTGATTSIFSGTAPVQIGAFDTTSEPFAGKVYEAEIRQGAILPTIPGSVVASPNFGEQLPGVTSFVDSTTKTWTLGGTAAIVADAGAPLDRFYGFVDSGFEQGYLPPSFATCTVKLTDRLSAVAGALPDVFDYAIQTLSPDGLWVLDAGSGAENVADSSGNGNDGNVSGDVKFGEPPVAAGHGTSARFTPNSEGGSGFVDMGRSPIVAVPTTVSVVATFKAATAAPVDLHTLFVQGSGGVTAKDKFTFLSVGTSGKLNFVSGTGAGAFQYQTDDSVVDGEGHIAFAQSNGGISVDTATLDSDTIVTGIFVINGVGIGGFKGVAPLAHWDGWIGTVALWNSELTLGNREALLDGYTKLSGLRSDEHVAWALDRIGVPAAHRNLDQGSVLMGPAETRGRDALDYIREVVSTEQGEFYVDHRDGGKLRFRHRYARFVDTRSTTSQVTFTDDTTDVDGVGILIGGLDVAPNGIDGIVNQAQVKWRDGEESSSDASSVASYGPQGRSVTTQATTATQARSAGDWLVARYAQPRSRVRGIATRPDASATALTAARQLKGGDRVSYRFHPQGVGSATELDLFIEGVDQSVSDGVVRTAVYRLAPVNTFTPWIWGTSAWNTTKYWG